MKRLRLMAVVGTLSAMIVIPLAYAGGLWFGLPVVGGAAYCQQVTPGVPGTTAVCSATGVAGPTSTTGNELIPADLNPQGTQAGFPGPGNASSSASQTGYLPLATAASGAYLLTSPTGLVNMTVTVPNGITNVIQNLTGSMTTYALILPVTPVDGQLVRFAANATITTLFVTTAVGSLAVVDTTTKPTSLAPNGVGISATATGLLGYTYLYNLSNNKWFRMQ